MHGELIVEKPPAAWLLRLRGEHDLATADTLDAQLEAVFLHGTNVVVDLSDAVFIDSSTVGAIFRSLRTARHDDTGTAVGMTTFMNLDPANRRLEIGSTWLAKSAQRTGINTEAKLLMLGYAFDELDCVAVEFRTHWHNLQSRRAIAELGAKQDGVLRNHQLWRDGTLRDTVVFSIIASEWPTVRLSLQERLSLRERLDARS